ncbi:MAG: DUF4276 family protein [Candidatus Scalindua rubra]|uniref:Uncharacterized protein n=1 Tax=Candidatus Scalindua brodae TaxID=237368 RepID=A0A0B0ERE7_9BACT|nr:MAG: hypothetical protein SCABRO_00524 [Candidatus Scalindua brodae]MBZ0108050.1 DUF4276 family protein [Candidatus Scalindua rubra]TWU33948.1 hypothetical protein S225a_12050 [Candidatus Brocadiaceae bacterium S225]
MFICPESKTNYIKTVHGPDIAKEIGLKVLREKCFGFSEWVNKLEAMGT